MREVTLLQLSASLRMEDCPKQLQFEWASDCDVFEIIASPLPVHCPIQAHIPLLCTGYGQHH